MSKKKVFYKRWWFIGLVIFAIIMAVPTEGEKKNNLNESTSQIEKEQEESNSSIGEKQAVKKAKTYLNTMSFSHSGLIEQLEFDGFTNSEAKYAANNCSADWKKQAAKKAETYLDTMSFSRSGLIEQLEFDGFTTNQATYGAEAVGY